MAGTGGSTSTTSSASTTRDEVVRVLRDAGFEVHVADTYDAPVDLPGSLPGWYVVRATKPIS